MTFLGQSSLTDMGKVCYFSPWIKRQMITEGLLLLNVFFKHPICPTFHAVHTIGQYFARRHLDSCFCLDTDFKFFSHTHQKETIIDLNRIRSTDPYQIVKSLQINWVCIYFKGWYSLEWQQGAHLMEGQNSDFEYNKKLVKGLWTKNSPCMSGM